MRKRSLIAWQKDRVKQFREFVQLWKLPKPSPGQGVVALWFEVFTPLLGQGWDFFFENVWYENSGGIGEWGFKRNRESLEERLAVKIYVSSIGVEPARRHFRRQVMSSTEPELPYSSVVSDEAVIFFVKAPSQDGRIRNDSVLQLYRNVVWEVQAYDAEIDVFQVAHDLLSLAKNNSDVPLNKEQPVLSPPDLPDKLSPGEEIHLHLPAASDPFGDFRSTNYHIQVQTRDQVEFTGCRESEAFFRLRQPGGGKIRVQAVDRGTLLSKEIIVEV